MPRLALRRASAADLDALSRVWHDAWNDSHRALVPAALLPHRTHGAFRRKLESKLADTIVCDEPRAASSVAGFAIVARDGSGLLEQFMVHRDAWPSRKRNFLFLSAAP